MFYNFLPHNIQKIGEVIPDNSALALVYVVEHIDISKPIIMPVNPSRNVNKNTKL